MLKHLTPNLMVRDVSESMKFYQSLLGFRTVVTVPDDGPPQFALLSHGPVQLMLQSKVSLEDDIPHVGAKSIASSAICYVDVDDVEKLHKKLAGKVEVVMPMRDTFYGTREFYIRDPDGYVFGFAEDRR